MAIIFVFSCDNLFSNFKEYERKVRIFNIYEKETLIYKRLQSIDLDHCSTKYWSQPISRLWNQFPSS